MKKGYKAEKGLTKSVDIIDKHFDNVKFDGIKKEMVIDYVAKVKKVIESYGVRCELEGVPSEKLLWSYFYNIHS